MHFVVVGGVFKLLYDTLGIAFEELYHVVSPKYPATESHQFNFKNGAAWIGLWNIFGHQFCDLFRQELTDISISGFGKPF